MENVTAWFTTIDVSSIVTNITSSLQTLLPAVITIVGIKKVFYTITGAIKGA